MSTYNLSEVLRAQAHRRGTGEALVDGDERWTYVELDRDVDRYAAALREAGVARDDLVGVLAKNQASYVLVLLALSRIGAVSVPLNWRLHANEQAYVVDHAGISSIVYDDEFLADVAHLIDNTGLSRSIAIGDRSHNGSVRLDRLLAAQPADVRVADVERSAGDVHRILYTSGTTARPKGVIHTFGNVHANHVAQVLELELRSSDRILISAPLFHVSGLEAPGLAVFVAGATMVLTPTFKPEDIATIVAEERVTGLVLAAQIVFGLLAMDPVPDFSSVRYLLFGGVAPTVRRTVKAAFPHIRLVDTFGMTELCNGVCYMDSAHEVAKVGALGVPFPLVHIRIVDESFAEVAPGVDGEIVVRGPKVSPGYWRDDAATARTRRDGWFLTGDVGRIDEDGYLWFVDRRTDLIKSGGENVAGVEIERVIAQLPGVAEVAVIGVPDEQWDEVPKAYVILQAGNGTSTEDIRNHCLGNLAKFKVPKYVEIVDHLPRNDSGKVLKKALREQEKVAR